MTVEALTKYALKRLEVRPVTRAEYQRLADVEILPAFGRRAAVTLTRREIRAWAEKKAKYAPYVANRAFGLLRRIYSFGVGHDQIPASPFPYLKPPSSEQASDRVLSAVELWALREALRQMPTSGSDVVRLLMLTGVRRAMVLGARREEFEGLDGLRPQWVIPGGFEGRTKSKREHVVPLSRQARALVLERMRASDGNELFPAGEARRGVRAVSVTKVWRSQYVEFLRARVDRILTEAGADPAPRWTIHNLRHTTRTHMREQLDVADDVAELILGHTRGGVEGIYNRAKLLKERRAALDRWADYLDELPAPSRKVLAFDGAASAGDGRGTE
jgi:integrase